METNSTTDSRSEIQDTNEQCQANTDSVEYVGFRVDGQAVVLDLSEHRRLSLERSLDLVNHSPASQPKLLT